MKKKKQKYVGGKKHDWPALLEEYKRWEPDDGSVATIAAFLTKKSIPFSRRAGGKVETRGWAAKREEFRSEIAAQRERESIKRMAHKAALSDERHFDLADKALVLAEKKLEQMLGADEGDRKEVGNELKKMLKKMHPGQILTLMLAIKEGQAVQRIAAGKPTETVKAIVVPEQERLDKYREMFRVKRELGEDVEGAFLEYVQNIANALFGEKYKIYMDAEGGAGREEGRAQME
jgi:hypothetical protein